MTSSQTILLVEDNVETQRVIELMLAKQFRLEVAATLGEAQSYLDEQPCDLVLLDVTLPDGDGYTFCAKLKSNSRFSDLPVFFLTAKNQTEHKVQGFKLGADDYVAKPFDPDELRARIEAKLQKERSRKEVSSALSIGNLKLNLNTQQAYLVSNGQKEQSLDLSPIEFKLLLYFARHVNQVLSRAQLVETLWGDDIHVLARTVDAHVSRLRKKITGCSHTIKTAHNMGYVFQESGPNS